MTTEEPWIDRASPGAHVPAGEAIYRLGFQSSPFGVLFHDACGAILDANPAAQRILGLSLGQLKGRDSVDTQWQSIHEDGSPFPGRDHPAMEALRTGKPVENVVIGVLNPVLDTTQWLQVSSHPLGDPAQGQALEVMTTVLDISASRQAQLALRDSEARFRTFFEAGADAAFILRLGGSFLDANAVAVQRYGYSLEELRTMDPDAMVPPRLRGRLAERLQEGLAKGLPFDWVHQAKDGTELPVVITLCAIDLDGTPGLIARVGQRKDQVAEAIDKLALREAEARIRDNDLLMRLFMQHTPVAIAMLDPGMNYLLVSQRWLEHHRLPAEDLIGRNHYEVMPEVPERWRAAHQRCLAGAVERCEEDLFTRRDGTSYWLRWEIRPWHRTDASIGGLIIFSEDITERRRVARALQESEEHYRMLFASDQIGVSLQEVILDAQGQPCDFRYLQVNRAMETQCGLSSAQLVNHTAREVFPELEATWMERYCRVAVTGEPDHFERFQAVTKRYLDVYEYSVKAGQFVVLTLDSTDRKHAEQLQADLQGELRAVAARLRKAQEDERLRVSREIHDDLGQLLTALKIEVGGLERKLAGFELPPALHPLVDRAVHAAELTDAVLAAVQRIAMDLRPSMVDQLGLEDSLRQELRRLQERSGLRCTLDVDGPFPRVPPQVAGDLFHICREALTNILRHAQAGCITLGWRQEDGTAVFTVTDDGIGMGQVDLTAKAAVGLAGMRERAALCGGTLTFESRRPHGTTVTVHLPVAGPEPEGSANP